MYMLKKLDVTFNKKDKISIKNDIINQIKIITSDDKSIFFKIKKNHVFGFNESNAKDFIHNKFITKFFEKEDKDEDNEKQSITLTPIELDFFCDGNKQDFDKFDDKKRFYLISLIFKKLIDEFGLDSEEEYYAFYKNIFYKFSK